MSNRDASSDRPLSLFAVTAPGLEEVCAGELRRLGVDDIRPMPGGVAFTGDLTALYRANLWLRSASRVLVRVGSFRCRDFPSLFKKALRVPWGRYVRPKTPVRVKAACHRSRLQHSGRVAEATNDAIDRSLGREGARPEGEGAQLVLVRVEEDVCTLSVDSSGQLLHRRGYRVETGLAPIRETLAAGILLRLGWDGRVALTDPMCGSGTFVIEGALLALGRAPGLARSFAFMAWPRYRPGRWQVLLQDARRRERPAPPAAILGGELAPQVLEGARRNAERAGVGEWVRWHQGPMVALSPPDPSGLLVCNPPYGERVGERGELSALYRDLGRLVCGPFGGWDAAFIAPSPALDLGNGLAPECLARLSNGGLPVDLMAIRRRDGAGSGTA